MAIKLAHYLGRTIYVAIDALFEDREARPFRLIAIDDHGVWLESEILPENVNLEESVREETLSPHSTTLAFFPFCRITYAVGERYYLRPTTRPPESSSEQVSAESPEKRTRERSKKGKKKD
jgi:hypothetical protein